MRRFTWLVACWVSIGTGLPSGNPLLAAGKGGKAIASGFLHISFEYGAGRRTIDVAVWYNSRIPRRTPPRYDAISAGLLGVFIAARPTRAADEEMCGAMGTGGAVSER